MKKQEFLEIKNELEHSNIPKQSVEKIINACRMRVVGSIKDISDDGIFRRVCNCGNIIYDNPKFCKDCGQRIEE